VFERTPLNKLWEFITVLTDSHVLLWSTNHFKPNIENRQWLVADLNINLLLQWLFDSTLHKFFRQLSLDLMELIIALLALSNFGTVQTNK